MKLSELNPAPYNPRKITPEALKGLQFSLAEFGDISGITFNTRTRHLVSGHQRVEAILGKFGNIELHNNEIWISKDEQIPVRFVDWSEEKERAANIAANATTITGEFTADLAEVLESVKLETPDIYESLMLGDMDIPPVELGDEPEKPIPAAPATPIVKRGDMFLLGGKHRILCGDSTNAGDVELVMGGAKADMTFTDPPYGNGKSGKYGRGQLGIRTIEGDEDFSTMEELLVMQTAPACMFFLQWRTFDVALQCLKRIKYPLKTIGVWDKKNAGLSGNGGMAEQWEAMLFAGDVRFSKFGGNVFTVSREVKRRSDSPHPHQKPIELYLQILDYLREYRSIFDPFLGSGTTLIAADKLKRKCYGIEIEPRYVEVIIRRYAENCSDENGNVEFQHLNGTLTLDEIVANANAKEEKDAA